MYQDVFIEKSVRRHTPMMTKVLNVVLIVITVLVFFQFLIDYRSFGIPLVIMVILCYFVTKDAKVEFDYELTNTTLEITKIVRQTKRKPLLEFDLKEVQVVARSKTEPVQPYIGRRMKTYDCTSHMADVPYYTMIVRHETSGDEIKILFEPGEKLLDAMSDYYPDRIHK